MIPCAIYARFSTNRQDTRSIEDQLRKCREFAARNGYYVVAEFSDAAVSGTHTQREQLQALLTQTRAKRPPFRAVIVDDLSRLSRDIGDTHRIIFHDLAGAGIKLVDTAGLDSESESGEMLITMSAIGNAQYVRNNSKQTHRGMTGRALAGFSTGGSLYGYRTIAEANPSDPYHPRKLWQAHEPEAAIVRRIFDLYDHGAASYKAIAETLNAERIAAPRDGRKGHKIGFGWNHTSVRSILLNEKYVGVWVWNTHKWTRKGGKSKRRERPEHEHVTKQMPELAIIDRKTWDRVQARIARMHHADKSGTHRGRPAGSGSRPYLVSGLLKCGVCGGPISVSGQKTKNGVRYASFGCSAHRSRGASVCPNTSTISEKRITTSIVDALKEKLTGDEVREAFARAFERRVSQRRSGEATTAKLERELQAAQRRVSNATKLMVEMPDDLDLRRQREADKSEVTRLQAAIAEHNPHKARPVPSRDVISAAIAGFIDSISNKAPERGREALAKCLPSSLTVTPSRKSENPGLVVTGVLDLRGVLANFSSGGPYVEFAGPRIDLPIRWFLARAA